MEPGPVARLNLDDNDVDIWEQGCAPDCDTEPFEAFPEPPGYPWDNLDQTPWLPIPAEEDDDPMQQELALDTGIPDHWPAEVLTFPGPTGRDLSNGQAALRRRLRGKQLPLPAYEPSEEEARKFRESECFKKFRLLTPKYRRRVLKTIHQLKFRAMGRAKLGRGVTLKDGATYRFSSEIQFARESERFVSHLLSSIANSERDFSNSLRGAAMTLWLDREAPNVSSDSQALIASGPAIMLTWQGEFGIMDRVILGVQAGDDVNSVCAKVRADSGASELWLRLQAKLRAWSLAHKFEHYAIAVELCTKTYLNEGLVRIHVHAWLKLDQGNRRQPRTLPLSGVSFCGVTPHCRGFGDKTGGLDRSRRNVYSGCFYVMVPKIGGVWSFSTTNMHVDYTVQPFWVTTLYAGRKITAAVAKAMFTAAVVSAESNLKNLETVERQLEDAAVEDERLAVEAHLRARQKPFRVIPEVQRWLRSFDTIRDRYRFLVLDGPSQVGKTRYVGSLTSVDAFLNVDCAGAVTPDLRSFRRSRHKLVLYDEAGPELVIHCKKLFQSSVDLVRLGSSATNMYCYTVWMHRVKQVVCSNKWQQECQALTLADRSWIEANSVYVYVDQPLWQE